jgi:hypothetical protein
MISLRSLAALLLLLTCTAGGRADPIVTGSATLQGDGSYLYQYTLTNPATGIPPLRWFMIDYNTSLPTNVTQTGTWFALGGTPYPGYPGSPTGFYAWINHDGQPGGTTASFSFTSKVAPGLSSYSVVAPIPDPSLPLASFGKFNAYNGLVVGPATAPEPGTAALLAVGGGLLLLRRLRRRPIAT